MQNFGLRYGYTNDIQKGEIIGFDRHGCIKEENWDAPGSSGYKQVVRGRGGRPRGKSQKRVAGSASKSGKRGTKQVEPLTQILLQQGVRTTGQKHGRGRRTVRKRRTEKKAVPETLLDYLDEKGPTTFRDDDVEEEEPRNSGREVGGSFSNRNMVVENDESSNSSMEAGDSDDNANENEYQYTKWGPATYGVGSNIRSNEIVEMSEEEDADEIEDDNCYEEEEDGMNLEGDAEFNDDDDDDDDDSDGDGDGEENRDDEGSESPVSGDYSD